MDETNTGPARVLRWQSYSLIAGTCGAFLGTAMVLWSERGRPMRGAGWWLAGLSGGILTAAFAFPVKALTDPTT